MSIGTETNQPQQTTTNASTAAPKAGVWQTVKTTVSEYKAKSDTLTKNTKQNLSIQKKQILMSNRKRDFGMEYMNLMENDASPEELEACVANAMQDIATMKAKICKYEGRIATNQEELERKIGGTATFTQPSVTVTPSTDSSEKAPAAAVSESNDDANAEDTPKIPYPTIANLNEKTSDNEGDDDDEDSDDDLAGTEIANESTPSSIMEYSNHESTRSNVVVNSTTTPTASAAPVEDLEVKVEPEPAEKPATGEGAMVH